MSQALVGFMVGFVAGFVLGVIAMLFIAVHEQRAANRGKSFDA